MISTCAQSAFFSSPFLSLHELVLAHLAAQPTVHSCLPLLSVSHHWRKITIKKLVAEFSQTDANLAKVDQERSADQEGDDVDDEADRPGAPGEFIVVSEPKWPKMQ